MKKKFSFLSKLGVSAAAVALIGGGLAWAQSTVLPGYESEPEGQEAVWTMLTSNSKIAEGTNVAIVHLTGDKEGKMYAGANGGEGESFWSSGGITSYFTVANLSGGTFNLQKGENYLSSACQMSNDKDADETTWHHDGFYLKDKNSKGFYWVSEASFNTSGAPGKVYVVKDYVYVPTITSSVTPTDYTPEGGSAQKVLRYNPAEGATNPVITVSAKATTGQYERLYYTVKIGSETESKNTEIGTLSATVNIDEDCANQTVVITAKTQVMDGDGDGAHVLSETSEQTITYTVVELATPTLAVSESKGTLDLDATPITLTRDENEQAVLKGDNVTTGDVKTEVKLSTAETSDYAATLDLTEKTNEQSYTINVKSTRNGATATATYNVTLKPYFSTTESTALANAAISATLGGSSAAIDGTIRAQGGQEVVLTFSKPTDAKYTKFKLHSEENYQPHVAIYTADTQDGLSSATATDINATLNSENNTLTFTLPNNIVTTKWIKISTVSTSGKGYFFATNELGTYDYKNKVRCTEKVATFKNQYDGRAFVIGSDNKTLSYNTSDVPTEIIYTIKLGSNNAAASLAYDNLQSLIVVVDGSDNKIENQPAIDASTAGTFKLTWDSSKKLTAGSYKVVFPKGSLKATSGSNTYTNQADIKPTITVAQDVDFNYILANDYTLTSQPEKVCIDKNLYLIIDAKAGEEARTVTMNTEETQTKASITNTESGASANCDLTLTQVAANKYQISGITDAFKNSFATSASYKISIPAGLFKADNSTCAGVDAAVTGTICHNVTYSVESGQSAEAPIVVDNAKTSFSFNLKAVIGEANYQSIKSTEGLPVTISKDGASINAIMKIAEKGEYGISVATIAANENTKKADPEEGDPNPTDFASLDGAYTVNIPAGTFTLCGCESPAMTVYVQFGTPTFSFTENAEETFITDIAKEMYLTAKYTIGGKVAYPELNSSITSNQVKVYSGSTLKANGTLEAVNATTGAYKVSLANTLAAGTYTVKVVKDAFTTGATKNAESTGYSLTVKPNVTYTYSSIADMEDGATSFDVEVVLNSNAALDNATITADASKFTIPSGPTVSSVVAKGTTSASGTAASKKCTFTVNLASALAANSYNLNIAEGAFTASLGSETYNANKSAYASFNVLDKVDFEAVAVVAASATILPSETAVSTPLVIKAYNDNDHDYIRTSEVTSVLTGWQIAKTKEESGTAIENPVWNDITVEAREESGNEVPGNYTFSNIFSVAGTYTVKAPVGVFSVDASKNTEAITWDITVQGAPNWNTEVEKTVAKSATKVVLTMSDLETTTYVLNGADQTKMTASWTHTVAGASEPTSEELSVKSANVNADGQLEIVLQTNETTPTDITFNNDPTATWTIILKAGAVKAGLSALDEEITVTVKCSDDFEFVDGTTTQEQVSPFVGRDLDNLSYTRTFTNTQCQAWCVPFDVKADDFEGLTFLKLTAITEDDGSLNFHYKTLTDEVVYAGRPYIVKATTASADEPFVATKGYTGIQLKNISIIADRVVESSTTTNEFKFIGTYKQTSKSEASLEVTTAYSLWTSPTLYYIGSDGQLGLMNAGVKAWRWYLATKEKDVSYARIVIDDDEAAGINSVDAENSNVANGEIYNLAGQRMDKMSHGINIVNGKKVLVK